MIVPIKGNVTYQITLDPTVWIFDDRKILLSQAFVAHPTQPSQEQPFEKTERIWSQEVYQQTVKPPINRSIKRSEREQILKNSYVMPIKDFLEHADIKPTAKSTTLMTTSGDVTLSLEALTDSYLLFALDGKPLTEGPVHLLYKDGSNQKNPIKGIKEIVIN